MLHSYDALPRSLAGPRHSHDIRLQSLIRVVFQPYGRKKGDPALYRIG